MAIDTNYYENAQDVPWATARAATLITPHNSTDTTALTSKGLLVLTAGNLEIDPVASAALAAFAVTAGQIIPVQCALVKTGTTATVLGLA